MDSSAAIVADEFDRFYSEDEVDALYADLREIGMVHFVRMLPRISSHALMFGLQIRKYHLEHAIPLRKLLMAFGMLVVGHCDV